MKRWWEHVRPNLHPSGRVQSGDVGCGESLSPHSGKEQMYHDISTKYVTWPSGAYVDFMSYEAYGFGAGIPVTYMSVPSGYAFYGALPVCTSEWVCANGQPRICYVELKGELNTSVEPDELSYQYFLSMKCGGVLTCTEEGSFKGTRSTGDPQSLEGSFYGTQAWTAQCCAERWPLP